MNHLKWIYRQPKWSSHFSVCVLCVCVYTPHSESVIGTHGWLSAHTHTQHTALTAITLSFSYSPSSFILRIYSRQRFLSAGSLKHGVLPWAHTHTHTLLTCLCSLTHYSKSKSDSEICCRTTKISTFLIIITLNFLYYNSNKTSSILLLQYCIFQVMTNNPS